MATDEQVRNTLETVGAMVDGAARVMQRMHPEMKIRSWNELTQPEQMQMAQALHSMLTPLAVILSGRPGEQVNGSG